MNKEIEELMEKMKNGSATKEETMAALKLMNASLDAAKDLIDAVKEEQKA